MKTGDKVRVKQDIPNEILDTLTDDDLAQLHIWKGQALTVSSLMRDGNWWHFKFAEDEIGCWYPSECFAGGR